MANVNGEISCEMGIQEETFDGTYGMVWRSMKELTLEGVSDLVVDTAVEFRNFRRLIHC